MNALELVSVERGEQISKHNYTVEWDVKENDLHQLVDAATGLLFDYPDDETRGWVENEAPEGWNPEIWKKMVGKSYKERLITAAALLLAEYDRIDNTKK